MPADYSGTPLVKKLDIKPGFQLYFHHSPEHYFDILPGLPKDDR